MVKYEGNTPVKPKDKVELIINNKMWHVGRVHDALATQFTILVNKKVKFFFYVDKGLTWRPLKTSG